MNLRASWTGNLSIPHLGVDLPLKMMPASTEQNVELRMICREHGSTVEQTFQCADGGETVERDDLGRAMVYTATGPKGFPVEHVIAIEAEELEQLKESPNQTFTVTETRSVYDFDPALITQAYRIWTDPIFESTWASLWRSMDRLQIMAYGTLGMSGRTYRAALRTSGKKEFSLYRLHWDEEMRSGVSITHERANPTKVAAFTQALDELRAGADIPILSGVVNRYNSELRAVIAKKETDFFSRIAKIG